MIDPQTTHIVELNDTIAVLLSELDALRKSMLTIDAICCGALEAGRIDFTAERVQEVARESLRDGEKP